MKFKKINLFLVLILSLFLFSGCSEDIDCSDKDSTYLKYGFDEESKSCVIIKEIPKDKCGNGIAEVGETYCNCPDDVLKTHPEFGCTGSKGDYLDKKCDDFTKTCVLAQNDKVVLETKALEFKNMDLVFSTKANYYTPFILNSEDENKIKIDISLLKYGSTSKNYKNIIVKELRIEDSRSNILGLVEYNQQIQSLGSSLSIKEVELADTKKYETIDNLRLKLIVSYDVEYLDSQGYVTKTEPKIETMTSSLSRFIIINPNFYEDK